MLKSFIAVAFALSLLACGGSEPPKSPTTDSPTTTSSSTPSTPSTSAPEATPPGGGEGCKDKDGKVHKVGEEWNDGCNNCSCGPNGAKCTRRACDKP